MTTINHVGFVPFNVEDARTKHRRPVFVFWFDEFEKPLSELIDREMTCIFCGFTIKMPDFRGTTLANPDQFEYKHLCSECYTHYIFNKAPKDLRDQISWSEYVKERED